MANSLNSFIWLGIGVVGILTAVLQVKFIFIVIKTVLQQWRVPDFIFYRIRKEMWWSLLLTLFLVYGLFLTIPELNPLIVTNILRFIWVFYAAPVIIFDIYHVLMTIAFLMIVQWTSVGKKRLLMGYLLSVLPGMVIFGTAVLGIIVFLYFFLDNDYLLVNLSTEPIVYTLLVLAVALGLVGVFENWIASLTLLTDASMNVNDLIEINGIAGKLNGIRGLCVELNQGGLGNIDIPSGDFLLEPWINHTRSSGYYETAFIQIKPESRELADTETRDKLSPQRLRDIKAGLQSFLSSSNDQAGFSSVTFFSKDSSSESEGTFCNESTRDERDRQWLPYVPRTHMFRLAWYVSTGGNFEARRKSRSDLLLKLHEYLQSEGLEVL